ncbi:MULTISPECIES: diacylglycerol kinase [unclassified Aureimonas]|uniref:diacylglycerol kinase n=1 Tax=unclassified Aureimonas TaxID=2615206 RepID=UPI0007200631|nr:MULTISPECIES: diacylglycerol kinase [unclassified Aureimonas]ALN74410.1 hypothetical protein M673_16905 [Aureimonas sp. AU20]
MSLDLSLNRPAAHEKKRGAGHLFAAARYSFAGFRRILSETAFRHELMAGGALLALFALVGASPLDFLVQIVLMLVLLAGEALNTAIEVIVDRVSPEISDFAKQAKDLGSFAVFCLILANCGYAASVLLSAI